MGGEEKRKERGKTPTPRSSPSPLHVASATRCPTRGVYVDRPGSRAAPALTGMGRRLETTAACHWMRVRGPTRCRGSVGNGEPTPGSGSVPSGSARSRPSVSRLQWPSHAAGPWDLLLCPCVGHWPLLCVCVCVCFLSLYLRCPQVQRCACVEGQSVYGKAPIVRKNVQSL